MTHRAEFDGRRVWNAAAAILVLASVAACEKPVLRKADTETPTPQPQAVAPVPAQSPAQQSAPARASATPVPEASSDLLYVSKPFRVATAAGVVDFPAGKPVRLVRSEDDALVVSDGKVSAKAPASSFSKDLEGIAPPDAKTAAGAEPATADPRQALENARQQIAARRAEQLQAEEAARRARKKQDIVAAIADLDQRIAAAQAEIAEKKNTQRPVRKTYDVYGNLLTYQGRSTYTLSQDASTLPQLIAKRESLAKELHKYE